MILQNKVENGSTAPFVFSVSFSVDRVFLHHFHCPHLQNLPVRLIDVGVLDALSSSSVRATKSVLNFIQFRF